MPEDTSELEDRLDELERTMEMTRGTMEELRRGIREGEISGRRRELINLPEGLKNVPLGDLEPNDPAVMEATLDEIITLPGDLNERPLEEITLEDLTQSVGEGGSPVAQWVAACGGGSCAVIYNGEEQI
jgi:hypothetical protein